MLPLMHLMIIILIGNHIRAVQSMLENLLFIALLVQENTIVQEHKFINTSKQPTL